MVVGLPTGVQLVGGNNRWPAILRKATLPEEYPPGSSRFFEVQLLLVNTVLGPHIRMELSEIDAPQKPRLHLKRRGLFLLAPGFTIPFV